MSAVLLAPAVVLVSATLADANPTVLALATAIGLLAALVQFLGLVRWPFAVPYRARLVGDPASSPATRDAVEVTFQTLNRYLGVAVGEHLGHLFTGLWTALAGVALIQSDLLHPLFGVVGLLLAQRAARRRDDGDRRPDRQGGRTLTGCQPGSLATSPDSMAATSCR